MFIKVGTNEYLNLSNVLKLSISSDEDCFKIIVFSKEGKPVSTSRFYKNNEEHLILFTNAVKVIKDNTMETDDEIHYISNEDYLLLKSIKESNEILIEFEYLEGIVRKMKDGSAYYIKDNSVSNLTEEQFTLYYNVYKSKEEDDE